VTHERSSLTRSTYLQTNRNVCSAVVLQAKNEDVRRPGLSFEAALLEYDFIPFAFCVSRLQELEQRGGHLFGLLFVWQMA
jgi:hypothetical protein